MLGRFSPFYKGHQAQSDSMIRERGLENCLIIIGSSDSCNYRTPFSYEQRRKIIKQIYPEMKIVPLPDVNPELVYFDGSTNNQWLAEIEKLEKNISVRFVFYGGSKEYLAMLAMRFMTKIVASRSGKGGRNQALVLVYLPVDNDTLILSFDSDGILTDKLGSNVADLIMILKI